MTEKNHSWQATIITIFPEFFPGPLEFSLAGLALKKQLWSINTINIRNFCNESYKSVDDAPFGGGPGMVMRPDIVGPAISASEKNFGNLPLIYLTPRGTPVDQKRINQLAAGPGVRLL